MEAPKQKRIDIPSGVIPAGGDTFFIQYSLATTRFVEYLKRLPRLTYGVTFKGMYNSLAEIHKLSSNGNDVIAAITGVREKSINQMSAIKRFDENQILDVVDLCALFCNRPGEQIDKYDEAVHHEKSMILQNEGYATEDFFLLSKSLIDGLQEAYQRTLSLKSQKESSDIST
jgi:hypothetical protein